MPYILRVGKDFRCHLVQASLLLEFSVSSGDVIHRALQYGQWS